MSRTIASCVAFAGYMLAATAIACSACLIEIIGVEESDRRAWRSSDHVLIATVQTAELDSVPIGDDYYEVVYQVSIDEVFKGRAEGVRKIFSTRTVTSWRQGKEYVDCGHLDVTPGDRILVFANAKGEARLGICTRSRIISDYSAEDGAAIARLEKWRDDA